MIKSLGAGRQTAAHPPMQNSEVRWWVGYRSTTGDQRNNSWSAL